MIQKLIHAFIKDYENTTDKNVREKYSLLGGVLGIICNILLFISKLLVGLSINSIAIISDAFNNLSDMGSSLISIISAKLSNRPPDAGHPFGHGRLEYLSSLIIALIILFVGYKLCETSINKFFEPEEMEFSYWSMLVLIISIAIKGWMCQYNHYIGDAIDSSVNRATAADSINDVYATTGVLAATIAQQYTTLPVDAAAGTLIGLFIIFSGFSIIREVIDILLGKAPAPELTEAIRSCVMNGKYIVGTHELKVHDYGPGRTFASIHAEVPDTADLVEVHAVLDELEDELADRFQIDMNIHMDPLCTNQAIIDTVRELLNNLIQKKYPQYHTDHLRITAGQVRLNVICDLHIPPEEATEENIKKIRKSFDSSIRDINPMYRIVLAKVMPDR